MKKMNENNYNYPDYDSSYEGHAIGGSFGVIGEKLQIDKMETHLQCMLLDEKEAMVDLSTENGEFISDALLSSINRMPNLMTVCFVLKYINYDTVDKIKDIIEVMHYIARDMGIDNCYDVCIGSTYDLSIHETYHIDLEDIEEMDGYYNSYDRTIVEGDYITPKLDDISDIAGRDFKKIGTWSGDKQDQLEVFFEDEQLLGKIVGVNLIPVVYKKDSFNSHKIASSPN
jgi:hypothetical protein